MANPGIVWGFIYFSPSADTIWQRGFKAKMNVNEEIQRAQESVEEARTALLASGFTPEQMEHLGRFVLASISLIQYGILEASQDIKRESASQPGSFQTKVVR
jgi:hypothetical protein